MGAHSGQPNCWPSNSPWRKQTSGGSHRCPILRRYLQQRGGALVSSPAGLRAYGAPGERASVWQQPQRHSSQGPGLSRTFMPISCTRAGCIAGGRRLGRRLQELAAGQGTAWQQRPPAPSPASAPHQPGRSTRSDPGPAHAAAKGLAQDRGEGGRAAQPGSAAVRAGQRPAARWQCGSQLTVHLQSTGTRHGDQVSSNMPKRGQHQDQA